MPIHYHRINLSNNQTNTPLVLAIGNLDGVHLGHQTLIKTAKALADASGHICAALSFTPHPREYFNPSLKPLTLMRPASKIKALSELGVAQVIFAQFDQQFAALEAEDFIANFCVDTLNAHHIVTGENFHFGRNRRGNVVLLEETMRQLKLGYSCVEPVYCDEGEIISSSRIRQVLSGGNVQAATSLLGRPFSLEGRVGHGDKRGRNLGFPTANIPMHGLYLPAFGVYAVRIHHDSTILYGVANLGIRPTFSGDTPLLEVHIFDWDTSLYGSRLKVELLHYLRPEQKFTNTQLLIDQLNQDVIKAKQSLNLTTRS